MLCQELAPVLADDDRRLVAEADGIGLAGVLHRADEHLPLPVLVKGIGPVGDGPLVEADPEQLKEVLVNIIVNACEAMSTGGTVTIQETVVAERHGQSAVIRIRDTGPGIPESIRNKVFQPFFTTKDEGTGLGLSIAARIIEELGGRLNVTSPEGGGASFVIALPVKEGTP